MRSVLPAPCYGLNVQYRSTQGIDTSTVEGRIFFDQLALFAEYEREMISQRTKAGIEAARKRGKIIGRPRKLTESNIKSAKELLVDHRLDKSEIARELNVSKRTIDRRLN